ncbi:hypothetical protein GLOIN_2v1778584 [Rhizophagus irregularis DAOM 181602=DAOM 197198]|nr:hypothetical protein GLOIN_2v1778584 [Rhizophagus irregularis DAOM 181602=DAOM 197198]
MSNELKSYTRDLYGFWDWASENLPTENEDVNELVLLCKQFLIYGNLVDRTNLNSRKAFTIARDNSVEKFESGGDELVKGNRFIICMCSLNLLNGLSLIRENFSNTELAITLIQRRSEIASEKQVDLESNAVSRILNMEVRAQLPADTSDALLWKRIEQAKKLWKLFDAHSFSVSSISKMTYEDIQYIIDNVPVDYSIKIESSTCAQPKDTLLSDEKNSELSHPDLRQ